MKLLTTFEQHLISGGNYQEYLDAINDFDSQCRNFTSLQTLGIATLSGALAVGSAALITKNRNPLIAGLAGGFSVGMFAVISITTLDMITTYLSQQTVD